ncbi:MFS transporter [Scytonema millei]|uniref:MFS transporter n=1 Tax=Scytonema millei VB511283 TaxID=1245923 RepID=A0A9X5EA34_9CYAN|nr:MFS transporter [Scytonema millei]NHC37761.1 MFS transporter [Scytonema millei VB511283]
MLQKNLKILLYSSNIWYLGEGMFAPIFGLFTQKIGGNILDISGIWAAYLVATGIFTILVGKLSDRNISKAKLMIIGYALNAIFTFCYLFASSQLSLFVVQIGLGIASALATPTWNALYAQYEDRGNAGQIWGMADGQSKVMTGLAVVLGGVIVNWLSFNALFITMGTIQVIATLYSIQLLKQQRRAATTTDKKHLLRRHQINSSN